MNLRRSICILMAVVWITTAFSAPTAEPTKPRGLWFWSKPSSAEGAANVLGHPDREAEALATFARWHIGRLYGSYANLPVASPAIVAAWNEKLAAAGIRSAALLSEGSFALPSHRPALLAAVDRLLAFNAAQSSPSARFVGLALDIEPHAQPAWKTATPAAKRAHLEDFLAACLALRTHLDAHGGRDLPLSAALAYWLDRLPPEGSIGWTSAADRDDWFARLARAVPTISLMAYERPRPAAIVDAAAWELAHFPGRTIIALRARLGVEWKSLADLTAVLPLVEAAQSTGIDLENYELLRAAERAAVRR